MNSLRFKDSGVHLEIAEHEFLLSIQMEKSHAFENESRTKT